ncbi:MAG: HAD hydrolase family protein [Magnetococcus sp. WYHC-3]
MTRHRHHRPHLPLFWPPSVAARGRRVRLVVLDVDGVLTDGGIRHGDHDEHKRFAVRDGLGLRLLRDHGVAVGAITARRSLAMERRAKELDLDFLHQGCGDKGSALDHELSRRNLDAMAVAAMGDDLVDLPLLTRVGLATAPHDAHRTVLRHVHWIAPHPGGQGAVRALAEALLRAQGHWPRILSRYLPAISPGEG